MFHDALTHLLSEGMVYLPRIGAALAVLAAAWIGAWLVTRLLLRLLGRRVSDREIVEFLARVARISLLALGLVTALGTLGVDVAALVAGLGLTGFAVGFALKDIISNVLAGVLIILYKPFRSGDEINVSNFQGVVVDIDLRYTVLESEGKRVYVPNSMLFTNAVTVMDVAAQPRSTGEEPAAPPP